MNICFVIDNFTPKVGGPYTAIKEITQQLKKKNKISDCS